MGLGAPPSLEWASCLIQGGPKKPDHFLKRITLLYNDLIYLINLLWKLGLGLGLDSELHYFSILRRIRKMSTLSSANVTDVNLVLKERTHKLKIKHSMHQYSNSYAYFRQLADNRQICSFCYYDPAVTYILDFKKALECHFWQKKLQFMPPYTPSPVVQQTPK